MKKHLKKLMNQYGGEIVPFKNLTTPYKLAIAWYMSVDGTAWELPFESFYLDDNTLKKSFIKNINMFDKEYGKVKFGVIDIPIDVCKLKVLERMEDRNKFKNFEEYHKWYLGVGKESHSIKNAWPCILSDFDDEFFQDGWHRFHRYVQLKMPSIPCIVYV
jgi:hypothetical protein